jgi:hypothetical protein
MRSSIFAFLVFICAALLAQSRSAAAFTVVSYGSFQPSDSSSTLQQILSSPEPKRGTHDLGRTLLSIRGGEKDKPQKSIMTAVSGFFKMLGTKLLALAKLLLIKMAEAVIWLYIQVKRIGFYIQEMATGGFLIPQTEPPVYGTPFGGNGTLFDIEKEFGVKERDLLITETMQVQGTHGPYMTIRGIESLILGKDKLRFYLADKQVATIEDKRGQVGFHFYRGNFGEKIGWMEKVDEDYCFFVEPSAIKDVETGETPPDETTELEPAKPEPEFILSGDFIDRRFLMKNKKGEVVAKVKKNMIAFPAFNFYSVRIAPGMDPVLVLACLCVIDEDLEDKLKEKFIKAGKVALWVPKKVITGVFSGTKQVIDVLNPFT